MFSKRSKVLFVATILAVLYSIYLITYFGGAVGGSNDSAEMVGSAIATALVTPHMFMVSLGAVFGIIGFFARKAWAALVAAILYSVGTVLFIAYAMFTIPILILGFVGYSKQKKINAVTE